ncbi:MAG: hypothetical protein ABIY50_06445 [Ignavibacteria bacterium]
MENKFFVRNTGLINASGQDVIDFINRMSTNDLRKFPTEEFRKSVLTSDKGRIIDLINILNIKEKVLVLTTSGFEDKVIKHLDKYIIMDDVKLEKSLSNFRHIIVYGSDLSGLAKKMFNLEVKENKIYNPGNEEYLFIDDFKIETINVICNDEGVKKYSSILSGNNVKEMNCTEYEQMRIKSGIPEGVNEFNDQINPMECGLERYISFKKGCYIGQEVIARLDSQSKRPKQMVLIRSGTELITQEKIFTEENKEAGFVSSAIANDGRSEGLGFIRSINLDFQNNYFVDRNNEKIVIDISKIN